MFRPKITLPLLAVVLGVISCDELYVKCSNYTKCVPISSCNSLVYNFTLLSDDDKRLALQSNQCNGTESDPWICCASCGPLSTLDNILGGRSRGRFTSLDEFPWMAALNYRHYDTWNRVGCGGSLINQRYVLTSAHCLHNHIDNRSARVLTEVILGEYHLKNFTDCVNGICTNATHMDIEDVIIHPNYNIETFANDIGLIRLKKNVEYSDFIKPVCLPSTVNLTPSSDGDTLEICGWGEGERSRSIIKRKFFVPLFNHISCQEKFHDYNISDSQVCAGGRRNEDACRGDAGGPLMKIVKKLYAIEGIVSFGNKICGRQGWPSIYTRVSSFETWIRENVRS